MLDIMLDMESQDQKFNPKLTPSKKMKDFTELADEQLEKTIEDIDKSNDFARSVGVETSSTSNETQESQASTEEGPAKKTYDMKKRVAAGVAGTAALVATAAAIDARLDNDEVFNNEAPVAVEKDLVTLPNGNTLTIDDDKYRAAQGVPENPADMIVDVSENQGDK